MHDNHSGSSAHLVMLTSLCAPQDCAEVWRGRQRDSTSYGKYSCPILHFSILSLIQGTLEQVCSVIGLVLNGLLVSEGFGKHLVYLTSEQQNMLRKLIFALEIPFTFGTALSKISISLLLLRLLGKAVSATQKYLLHGINVFVCTYTIMFLVQALSSCRPVAARWDPSIRGKCSREDINYAFLYTQGGLCYRNTVRTRDLADWRQLARQR